MLDKASSDDPVVEYVVQEIRDKETEIRQLIRGTTNNANLTIIIIAGGAAYLGTRINIAVFSIMPIFINIVALTHLSYSTDTRHLAAIRDWLSEWVNDELGAPVYVVGSLSGYRRAAWAGLVPNVMATLVLVASWGLGITVSVGRPWFWPQIIGTSFFVIMTGLAAYDFLTIHDKTKKALIDFTPATIPRRTRLPKPLYRKLSEGESDTVEIAPDVDR